MTGVDSWSIVPLTNETVDGTVTWKEGQLPSTVNNSMRQMLADLRERFNDLPWFQYGTGDQGAGHLAVPSVYESATSFSITGADVTAAYHAARPVRAVGTLTGTIYGFIASSSYSAGTTKTTVLVDWSSGALTNETLVISIGLPILGLPAPYTSYYDPPIYIQGKPTNGEVFPIWNIVRSLLLPASLVGSVFTIGTNPASTLTIEIYKNAGAIGTVAFSTGGVPTVTFASDVTFTAGDQFSVHFPAVADSTGANIAMTFVFTVS